MEIGGVRRYAVKRTVSPGRAHSPVPYMPALRKCHARVGIQPGRIVAAQRAWSPVRRFDPGYPALALRTVSPVRWDCSVCPICLRSARAGLKWALSQVERCEW